MHQPSTFHRDDLGIIILLDFDRSHDNFGLTKQTILSFGDLLSFTYLLYIKAFTEAVCKETLFTSCVVNNLAISLQLLSESPSVIPKHVISLKCSDEKMLYNLKNTTSSQLSYTASTWNESWHEMKMTFLICCFTCYIFYLLLQKIN